MCGSRDWDDEFAVGTVLDGLLEDAIVNFDRLVVVEGCARGADSAACHFYDGPCQAPGGGSHGGHTHVNHEHYPADWKTHGRAAGFIRNQQMLDEGRPDIVVAFKDGFDRSLARGGTEDMVRRSKAAGVPVYVISHG